MKEEKINYFEDVSGADIFTYWVLIYDSRKSHEMNSVTSRVREVLYILKVPSATKPLSLWCYSAFNLCDSWRPIQSSLAHSC